MSERAKTLVFLPFIVAPQVIKKQAKLKWERFFETLINQSVYNYLANPYYRRRNISPLKTSKIVGQIDLLRPHDKESALLGLICEYSVTHSSNLIFPTKSDQINSSKTEGDHVATVWGELSNKYSVLVTLDLY